MMDLVLMMDITSIILDYLANIYLPSR